MKTSELQGAALDWAVALAEGEDYSCNMPEIIGNQLYYSHHGEVCEYSPSTQWALGGPIIERERIAVLCPTTGDFFDARDTKTFRLHPVYSRGATYLEAAMRCYVASKLGDEVAIPEELL